MRLDGDGFSLILKLSGSAVPLYFGPPLAADADLPALSSLVARGPRESQPDQPVRASLLPQVGTGFSGEPAVVATTAKGQALLTLSGWDLNDGTLTLRYGDPLTGLRVVQRWQALASGLLSAQSELVNGGSEDVGLGWLAALALPLPSWARHALQVQGRWGAEFQLVETPAATGLLEKVNRSGRSGFDGAHYLVACEPGFSEERGRGIAAHLAWSGNGRSLVEALPSGERQIQVGEWLAPGEIVLRPGETYRSPEALLAMSHDGRNGICRCFHRELRTRQAAAGVPPPVRRVHFNSWEAAYFDFDEQRLMTLAEAAAEVGAERFVLDDGWFNGRTDDSRALGDWTVDPQRFPSGLTPLIERVHELGMDFGLWVEPEMVSPDSQLYRNHPDWCLHTPERERPTQRHQLVLDLSREDVRDHLFGVLDTLLRAHSIAYLKWDHNRPLFPAESNGRPVGRAQTLGFYTLLQRIREAHPSVEIETCASGGARIDFGVAAVTARAWASDNTDPLERLRIHAGTSLFYPPEYLGAHVGRAPNPTTGRRTAMDFRCRAALFAHMGIELDPATLSPIEREELSRGVEHYKRWRSLIGSGQQLFADCDDPDITVQAIVAEDGAEVLILACRAGSSPIAEAPPVRLPGLTGDRRYRLTLVGPWPDRAARQLGAQEFWQARPVVTGELLQRVGLALPLVHAETAWLVHLERLARSSAVRATRDIGTSA